MPTPASVPEGRDTAAVADDDQADGGDLGWMSIKTASERLGITNRTLYRLIDEGQVPAYKFGRVIRLQRIPS